MIEIRKNGMQVSVKQYSSNVGQYMSNVSTKICCAMHLNFPSQDTHSRPFHWRCHSKYVSVTFGFRPFGTYLWTRCSRKNLATFRNNTNSCNPNFGLQNQEGTCAADRIIENNSMSPDPCECPIFGNTYHSNLQSWIWSTKQIHPLRVPTCQIWYGIRIACFLPGNCCEIKQHICVG